MASVCLYADHSLTCQEPGTKWCTILYNGYSITSQAANAQRTCDQDTISNILAHYTFHLIELKTGVLEDLN